MSLNKVLKFKFLRNPTFFLTLILFPGFQSLAQFGPVGVRTKFSQPDSLCRISLQTTRVPDSTRLRLIKIKCSFTSSFPDIYWTVSNAGAILAFRDSLLQKPYFLEKRNVYPFVQLTNQTKYWFEITRTNGRDGYQAARLLDEKGKVVLDEVFLCLRQTDLRILRVEVTPEPWIFQNK